MCIYWLCSVRIILERIWRSKGLGKSQERVRRIREKGKKITGREKGFWTSSIARRIKKKRKWRWEWEKEAPLKNEWKATRGKWAIK